MPCSECRSVSATQRNKKTHLPRLARHTSLLLSRLRSEAVSTRAELLVEKQSAFSNLPFSVEIFRQRNGAAIKKDYVKVWRISVVDKDEFQHLCRT